MFREHRGIHGICTCKLLLDISTHANVAVKMLIFRQLLHRITYTSLIVTGLTIITTRRIAYPTIVYRVRLEHLVRTFDVIQLLLHVRVF